MTTAAIIKAIEIAQALAPELAAEAGQVDRQAAFPAKNISRLGDRGLLGLVVPASLGGMEADPATFARVVLNIGEACASTGLVFVMHCCAAEVISRHGHKELAARIIPEIVAGKHLSTLAFSERGTGGHFYASDSKSISTGAAIALSGEKCFVTSGSHADSYVLTAQSFGADACTDTSVYLVERTNPGLHFEGDWNGLGMRGNSSIFLRMNECLVPDTCAIGEQGGAMGIALSTVLPGFLLGSAAVNTGIARAALRASIAHVKARQYSHTGQALDSIAVIRRYLGEMQIAVDASEAMMLDAASRWNEGADELLLRTLKAKQFACRAATEVTRNAMQVCGGIAYAGESCVARNFRDAMAGPVMAFTSDVILDMVGRSSLGMQLL